MAVFSRLKTQGLENLNFDCGGTEVKKCYSNALLWSCPLFRVSIFTTDWKLLLNHVPLKLWNHSFRRLHRTKRSRVERNLLRFRCRNMWACPYSFVDIICTFAVSQNITYGNFFPFILSLTSLPCRSRKHCNWLWAWQIYGMSICQSLHTAGWCKSHEYYRWQNVISDFCLKSFKEVGSFTNKKISINH